MTINKSQGQSLSVCGINLENPCFSHGQLYVGKPSDLFIYAPGSGSCAYLYLAEVCSTENRPLYFSVVTTFVGLGMLFTCILALFFDWQTISGIMAAISFACCVSLFLLPETPMWLRNNGRIREAEEAEDWLGMDHPAAVSADAETAADHRRVDDENIYSPFWKAIVQPTVWKPTLITFGFFVCQQGSGFYVLMFYSMDVLRDCRVQWDGVTVTVFLSIARVAGGMVFTMMHNVRRKTLTVVSSVGTAVSLLIIVAYMKVFRDVADPPYEMLLIVAFVAYVFFSLLSILPLPWTICGELFPMSIKGVMSGIAQIFGYELMFVVIKIYPSMVTTYGVENVWTTFAGFCVACALYGAFIMPETKGKSLDEILMRFESKKKPIKNSIP